MKKIACIVEYNGTNYHGFQWQQGMPTIQGHLEEALSKVADEKIQVICAGRTDAGVHALGQVIHFETNAERLEKAWIFGGNALLPKDIAITFAKEVPEDFHARFTAIARRYLYIIANHKHHPAIMNEKVTWHQRELDEKLMSQASQYFLGEQDFSSFRSSECQANTPFRRVEHLNITRNGEYIFIDIQANAFLHHMVRNIVGVLMSIGTCEQKPEWAKEVLLAKDRKAASITASAHGLYLYTVYYPEEFNLVVGWAKRSVPTIIV